MATGEALNASVVLKLDDIISPGLKNVLNLFSDLKKTTNTFQCAGLTKSTEAIAVLAEKTRALNQALGGIESVAGRAGSAMGRLWTRMETGANRAMGALKSASEKIGVLGGVGAGATLMEPIHLSAEYDFLLRHTAITEGFSGAAAEVEIHRLGALFNKDALATGQSSNSIAEAFRDLVQWGMSSKQAESLIGVHSRAATAYGITAAELSGAVFAMGKSLGIDDKSMPLALAGMAQASKEGRFKVTDFSAYLTGQAGYAKGLGLQGTSGAATLFALNEIVAQRTTTPGQAGEWINSTLGYISSKATEKSMAHAGINLPASIAANEKLGLNHFDAFLKVLNDATKGMDPEQRAHQLGQMFGRGEEKQVWQAVLEMQQEFNERRARYAHVDPNKPGEDFGTAFAGTKIQIDLLGETITQISREFGDDFVPVLRMVNKALGGMLHLIQWAKQEWPTATDYILTGAGALLALVTVLGIVGFVLPAVTAGFGLMGVAVDAALWPVLLIVAALALAYEAWQHWAEIVPQLSAGWKDISGSFAEISKWAVKGIKDAFEVLRGWFAGLWHDVAAPFAAALKIINDGLNAIGLGHNAVQKAVASAGNAMPTGAPGDMPSPASLVATPPVTLQNNIAVYKAGPDTSVAVLPPGASAPDNRGMFVGIP
jgi:TP901 family phage tail tape measure protein